MTYYEGIDYFVRKIEFPNMASPGMAVSNGDGTFTIYINSLFSEQKQEEALAHELRHLIKNHFYRDDDLWYLEDEAAQADPGERFLFGYEPAPWDWTPAL